MTSVTLFREGITKGPMQGRGGLGVAIRSMRANWVRVTVHVDRGEGQPLRQTKRHVLDLSPGRHEIHASATGLASATSHFTVGDQPTILAIAPAHTEGITDSTPLGQLEIRCDQSPQDLQPFRFYKELPSSIGRKSLFPSVAISVIGSTLALGAGLAFIAAWLWVLFIKGIFVGLLILAPTACITAVFVPAGLGGLVTAYRFLRLPPDWRAPS